MLTRAAPAIMRSLNGVFTPQQTSDFLSAVGQCSQPLQHRAGVSLGPAAFANTNGVGTAAGWNPAQYPELFPDAVQQGGQVEAPSPGGYRAGDWYTNYYGAPEFSFVTQLQQTLNQYMAENHYAGDTLTVGGPTQFTTVNTTNLTTQNITTERINDEPIDDPPGGPQGSRPRDGVDGAPGAPGGVGVVPLQRPPLNLGELIRLVLQVQREAGRAFRLAFDTASRLRDSRIRVTPHRAVQSVTFDADACDVVVKKRPETRVTMQMRPTDWGYVFRD